MSEGGFHEADYLHFGEHALFHAQEEVSHLEHFALIEAKVVLS